MKRRNSAPCDTAGSTILGVYFSTYDDDIRVYQIQLTFYSCFLLRSEITEFLAILTQAAQATGEEPYAVDAPPGKNMVPRTESFTKWKASDWKSYRETLVKIQTSMLQRDANASINEILTKEGGNPKIDPSRTVRRTCRRV